MARLLRLLFFSMTLCALTGCGVTNFGNNFSDTILNQEDPALVRAGIPAYLLLVDSLIAGNPEDSDWLQTGAKLYTLFSAALVDDPARSRLLSTRAFEYGQRALCAEDSDGCGLSEQPFDVFEKNLQLFDEDEVSALYVFTTSWLIWAKAHSDDWNVIASVPKIELALQRIIELDENYDQGRAWLYLGILNSLRPPSMGGDPDRARESFERALLLTNGQDLSVKVAYARYYARLVYDRELHDRLLYEVRNANAKADGLTLMNTLAQEEAEKLLRSGASYF